MDIKEHIKNRHLKRIMFAIIDDRLIISKPNNPDSHIDWFLKEGIIKDKSDNLFEEIVRGSVKDNGDIWFYIGKEFSINEKAEKVFFNQLKNLVKIMKIKKSAIIKGGKIKKEVSEGDWPAIKIYGCVSKVNGKILNI